MDLACSMVCVRDARGVWWQATSRAIVNAALKELKKYTEAPSTLEKLRGDVADAVCRDKYLPIL